MIDIFFKDSLLDYNCLVLPLFEHEDFYKQVSSVEKKFNIKIGATAAIRDFNYKPRETLFIYVDNRKISRILLLGLGKRNEMTIRRWKHSIGTAIISLQNKKINSATIFVPSRLFKGKTNYEFYKRTIIAIEKANYSFDLYKKEKSHLVKKINFATEDKLEINELEKAVKYGQIVGESVNYARQLGNTPPTYMTPSYLASAAKDISKLSLKCKALILSREQIKKLKMGCLLGVSRGSKEEPKFIILEYKNSIKNNPIVLVGKGITFDSGGISLKLREALVNMKFDMLGAATVLGIMRAIVKLNIKASVVALIPTCENMPDGEAYRPDDILTAMNGKTVEIENTDAEGRLILADALSYAKKYNPQEVLDFATLTGACRVALGPERSGLFTKDKKIATRLLNTFENSGEYLWQLPLGEEYTEAIKSNVADIKNVGNLENSNMNGGASIGAAFIEEFADFPWAHIDLSCCYYLGTGKSYIRGGANGYGVESVCDYLDNV